MIKDLMLGGQGATSKLGDTGLLILRVFVGLALALGHGLGKIQNPDGIIGGVRKMELPMPEVTGWLVILTELLGGLLLALGLLNRPAAFFIAITMGVAAFMVHGSDPFGKKELALAYLCAALLFLCTGGGRISIDSLIRK